MLICPDCANPLPSDMADLRSCPSCGWKLLRHEGIPDLFSSQDRSSPVFDGYLRNYDEIAEDDVAESIQPEDYHLQQTENFFSYLGDVRGLSVCDVGAGRGKLIDLIRDAGAKEITAVDIAMPYLARYVSTDGTRLVVANAENLPFEDEFDLVVCSDMLEHVLNPGDVMYSIRRALRAEGRVAIRVPYKDDLTNWVREQHQGAIPYAMGHLRDFNRENLQRLIRNAGFELEGLRFDGFYPERKRDYVQRFQSVSDRVDRMLLRRYGGYWEVAGIWPPLGRALMRPETITVLATATTSPTGP